MPNVLVEVGFITNKKEAKQLSKAQYKREIAKGLFESVIDFKINMKDDNRPIGVFDSGLGGLTVLRSLKETFPNESFIYFGDTARVPYGTKSQETIIRYSKEICDFLNKQDVKLIIVACNTVSALAVKFLKSDLKVPIINVIDPCVEFASKVTKNNFIGVIGTQATINSKAYNRKLDSINSNFKIISQECSLFVPLIEQGFIKHQITKEVCSFYLNKKVFRKLMF